MSDKPSKTNKSAKKSAKRTRKPETSVLGSLPATRPNRLGRHANAAGNPAPSAAAKPKASAKPKPAAKPKAAAKPKTTARPKAAAKPATARTTAPKPPPASPPRPQEPAAPPRHNGPPSSAPELVTTAVQAAGEVAQIGVGLGVRALKRAAKRLPGV
jgi:hypothetical protein